MNDPNNRTFLDMKQWNKHIGKTYYELHPETRTNLERITYDGTHSQMQ